MKKVKVVKKVIVRDCENEKVTNEIIEQEACRILAEESFDRLKASFEEREALDDFRIYLERYCISRVEGAWVAIGLIFAGLIDAEEKSFGRVLFYVADNNESFIFSFLDYFTDCVAGELFEEEEYECESDYCDENEDHCKGCMGVCFGDCGDCRHMKEGAGDE